MKKFLPLCLVLLLIMTIFYPLQGICDSDGGLSDNMKPVKYSGIQYVEYSTSAPAGDQIKYRTVGFTIKFTSATLKDSSGNPIVYTTILALDTTMLKETKTGTTVYDTWDIPFVNNTNPLSISDNTIMSRFLATYQGNTAYKNDISNFFMQGGTIYLDHIFTVIENGKPWGTLNTDGTSTGKIYFTEPDIKKAAGWTDATMRAFDQYYNRRCTFPSIPVAYAPPTPFISRDAPATGNIITGSTTFSLSDNIILYGDRSSWPSYAQTKYYKWEYKPVGSGSYSTLVSGANKTAAAFTGLTPGSYNVQLSEWYSASDAVVHTELTAVTAIIMNIDNSNVTITPVPDADKHVSQSQIDANDTINISITGIASLAGCSDPSKITKWVINMRKDPAGSDSQYQQFVFNTGLGLSQSATKVFTVPASVLSNCNSYTQSFAMSAVATVNGVDYTSSLAYCKVNLIKDTGNPVAVLDAPSSTLALTPFTVSGAKSYSPNGPIVSYSMTIPDTGWNSNLATDQAALPYGGSMSHDITLTVTDSIGKQDSVTKTITVTAPTPMTDLLQTGKLKKNRIAYFYAYDLNPFGLSIDSSKTTWTVKAVSGSGTTDSDACVVDNVSTDPLQVTYEPFTSNLVKGKQHIQLLFRKPGQYDITGTIVNSLGISGSVTKRYTIVDDLPPTGDVSTLKNIYRDTIINGVTYANLTITDDSYSPDGDFIEYRKIYVVYDSDNAYDSNGNPIFTHPGDTVIIVDESSDPNYIENNKVFTIQIPDIGKYEVHVYVREGFIP